MVWHNRRISSKGRRPQWRNKRSLISRLVWREQRYLLGQLRVLVGTVALIFVVGFASERIETISWSDFVAEFPSILSASAEDIAGRASVIDGDTLEIHGQSIRIWGIDAPESAQPCLIQGKPWRCGQKAALALSDQIGQQTVACVERDRDRYGRIVAKCLVAAQDIGAWLVSNGWALDYADYSGGGYSGHESVAAAAKIGIWRGTFDKPWEWRRAKGSPAMDPNAAQGTACTIKGNISENGKIYHLPSQHYYGRTRISPANGERWFCSEDEARAAGWRRAKR
jgi:endonuclease YncB( thermonuclease family)